MSFGCFVDIRQQDGQLVRMHYPMHQRLMVEWMGIQELMADKFNPDVDWSPRNEPAK